MSNLAVRLGAVGQRTAGLAAAQEAVDLRRELLAINRVAHLPYLAAALHDLAVDLAAGRRQAEGLAAAREAVDLRRELVANDGDSHLADLASSEVLARRLAEPREESPSSASTDR